MSLRREEQKDHFGNKTSYLYVSLATDVADPTERLARVKDSLDAARDWAQGDVELFAVWQDYYLLFGVVTLKMLALAEKITAARHPVRIDAHRGEAELRRLAAQTLDVVARGVGLEQGVVDELGDIRGGARVAAQVVGVELRSGLLAEGVAGDGSLVAFELCWRHSLS